MRTVIIVVVVLALCAAGGTYWGLNNYLDSVQADQASKSAAVIKPAVLGVLVAAAPIDAGKVLDPGMFEWQQWPDVTAKDAANHGAVVSDDAGRAVAQKDFEGSIARVNFLKGEPLTVDKVAHSDKGSTLSVVLAAGTRSMTLAVSPTVGAGGMVQPGDRVDVLLTADLNDTGAGTVDPRTGRAHPRMATETVMEGLKILTVDRRLAPNADPAVPPPTNVTVEVTPEQAEKLVTASSMGRFTLLMRPLADGKDPVRVGLPFATDVAIMPNLQAERQGTTIDKMDPRANPFIVPATSDSKKTDAAAPAPRKSSGIVVYRWTEPTVIPMIDGKITSDGNPLGSAPSIPAPVPATAPRPVATPTPAPAATENKNISSNGSPTSNQMTSADDTDQYYGAVPINAAAAAHIGTTFGGVR